ncbi:MAG: DUF4160 domain-containing protein [Ideonella sp.]|nr:DUF4160 domain-containing protein [Ideonella sp.]MBE7427097.1 DUF4160 domain-containing protein [Ideonella sp.]
MGRSGWRRSRLCLSKCVDGTVLAGDLPRAKLRLVQAWIEIHRDELTADWELATTGQPPFQIEPLR